MGRAGGRTHKAVARKKHAGDVLIVLHQEHSTPGRIGRLLQSRGLGLDIRRPASGDALPASLRAHKAVIIFGGPMSANDDLDHVKREIDWIGVPLREDKPFLGVCLGAQMLARHLGEKVGPHPHGRAEIGYYPIRPTQEGHAVCASPFPARVYQWHREGFDLPRGATLLAAGDDFEVQGCRYGANAFGLQFHPEVTYAMMCRWTARAKRMDDPGAQAAHLHRAGWYEHDAPVARWSEDFIDAWLDGARPGC